MIYELTNLDIALLIGTGAAIVIGAIIFFSVGIYHVKEGRVVILEKAGQYYKTLKPGWHYAFPIVYQRVAYYITDPQIRRYRTLKGNKLSVTYQLEDAKTFHYCQTDFETIMRKVETENPEINLEILQNEFAKRGLKFINIKKAEE